MAQNRKNPRRVINITGAIVDDAGKLVGECLLADVSEGGARITNLELPMPPDKFRVLLTKSGTVRRNCEVVRRSESELGVRFMPSSTTRNR